MTAQTLATLICGLLALALLLLAEGTLGRVWRRVRR